MMLQQFQIFRNGHNPPSISIYAFCFCETRDTLVEMSYVVLSQSFARRCFANLLTHSNSIHLLLFITYCDHSTEIDLCPPSGKTTMAKLLFRLIEIESGNIKIDNVDISRVDLSTLRSRMTIIQQDPTLFAGTLRHSLDPAGLYSDSELLDAIEAVGMKEFLGEEGLEMEISDGGTNVSAGQRQLLCMARAIVQKTKILIMDEASSNLDHATDELIQRMLKERFRGCTVITIAHRLVTILDYDQVIVMSDGRVEEMGSPNELSEKPGGAFAALLNEQHHGGNM